MAFTTHSQTVNGRQYPFVRFKSTVHIAIVLYKVRLLPISVAA